MSAHAAIWRRTLAFTAALTLHGAVAGVFLWEPARSGLVGDGGSGGGIVIGLGNAGAEPAAVARTDRLDAEASEPASSPLPPETVPEVAPPVEEAVVEPPAEEVAVAAATPRAVPPPLERLTETITAVPPDPSDAPPPEPAVRAEPVIPVLEPVPDETAPPPPPVQAHEERTVVANVPRRRPPELAPPPSPQPAPAVRRAPAPTVTSESTAAPEPAAAEGGVADEKAAASPGAGGTPGEGGAGGAGQRAAQADYFSTLGAWFERHKHYPRQARLRRQEGRTLLALTIARDGEVLAYAIDRGSGYPLLDDAVLDMIQRAERLPPFPDTMTQTQLQIVVPIQFELRSSR